MSNKTKIAAGLAGLMAAPTAQTKPTVSTDVAPEEMKTPAPVKGNYKTVCYSIPPQIAEAIRRAAYLDRRTIGAVVTEAFEQYLQRWKPAPDPDKNIELK